MSDPTTAPAAESAEKQQEKNMRAMLKLVRDFRSLSSTNDRNWVMNELAQAHAELSAPPSLQPAS